MTVYFITGANRGLGRALVAAFLAKSGNTVVAGVRNPDKDTSLSLSDLERGTDSKLITVKIESQSESDTPKAVKLLQSEHGIDALDVVVANAGYGSIYGDLSAVQTQEVQDMVDINALGPLRLFQATRTLLEKGKNPRFVLIGTPIASISAMEKSPFPMFAYGASKAVAHYLTRKIHCESPGLTAFVVDPGFMQTEMGNSGAQHFGYEKAFIPVEASRDFTVRQIEEATREKTSGKFVTIDDSQDFIAW